MKNTM